MQTLLYSIPLSNLTGLHSDYSSLKRIPALKQLLQSSNYETQGQLHAMELTVNVINSFRLSRGDEIEIIIQRPRIRHT